MKRSLVLCSTALLAFSCLATAGVRPDYDQQTVERPRRVQLPTGSFLGAQLGEVNGETVQRLKLREERGALIEEIVSGSSAAQAGLQKNDVVVKWDGQLIESARELSRHIRETPSGRTIRLGVIRDSREIEITVKMGERAVVMIRPLMTRPQVSRPTTRMTLRPNVQVRTRVQDRGHLGVQLQSMTPQLAEYFGLWKRTGALVVFVFVDSPAAKAGLKAGDVILSAGGETVENPMDLRRVLNTKAEGSVEFKVLRDKQEQTLTVQLEKGSSSWLQLDDYGDAPVRASIAPMVIGVPRIKIAPMAIAPPKIALTPMQLQMPKIRITPLAVPSMKIDLAPMKIDLPKIRITPLNFVVVPRRIVL